MNRAIAIADKYGQRLTKNSALYHALMHGYPSHGFVIDFEEAAELFENVSFANLEFQKALETNLFDIVRISSEEQPVVGNPYRLFGLHSPPIKEEATPPEAHLNGTKEEVTA